MTGESANPWKRGGIQYERAKRLAELQTLARLLATIDARNSIIHLAITLFEG